MLSVTGGFGSLFRLDLQRWKNPILVSAANGVGAKLKVAFELGMHRNVGADLVNHCVNDIAVQGASPLFFHALYGRQQAGSGGGRERGVGLADACKACGCVLIGGETAQMPGFREDGEYDLAGFIVAR